MSFKYRLSPLQACGCYLAAIILNLAFWGAVIIGIIKLVKWAWS